MVEMGQWLPSHDDIMEGKRFPNHGPFVGENHRSPVDSPHKRPVIRSFDVSFDVSLYKLLDKQSSCRWFETP